MPLLICQLKFGAVFDEEFDRMVVSSSGGIVQRSVRLRVVGLVWIAVIGEEFAYLRGVVLAGRARDVVIIAAEGIDLGVSPVGSERGAFIQVYFDSSWRYFHGASGPVYFGVVSPSYGCSEPPFS